MVVAAIKNIASYFPENVLTNDMLIAQTNWNWTSSEIEQKTGVSIRYVAGEGECASDLGIAAANKLFTGNCCNREDVDFLIFCTQSPDYFLPATACIVQEKLGLKTTCGAIDINQGCSGFIYGLALAKGLIETGIATNVLLITAETYTKFIHPLDHGTRTIFGDGAAATLITGINEHEEKIGPFILGTDGQGAENLIVPAGGLRNPKTQETYLAPEDKDRNLRSLENLYMNGPEIFNFTLKSVPKAVEELLLKSKMPFSEIDYFVFHQANKFMLERLRNKIKIPAEKFWLNLEYANTVSSTIPIALEKAIQAKHIKPGYQVMLVGFGVGYSWGATIIKIV